MKYSLFIGQAIFYVFRFKIPTTLGALRGPIIGISCIPHLGPSCFTTVCECQKLNFDNTIVKKYMYSYTISTRMFSNLRSLCTTPIACMKAKPSVISFAQRHTSLKTAGFSDLPGTDSGPLKMWLFKFPLHFSMTKAVCEVSLSSNMP